MFFFEGAFLKGSFWRVSTRFQGLDQSSGHGPMSPQEAPSEESLILNLMLKPPCQCWGVYHKKVPAFVCLWLLAAAPMSPALSADPRREFGARDAQSLKVPVRPRRRRRRPRGWLDLCVSGRLVSLGSQALYVVLLLAWSGECNLPS